MRCRLSPTAGVPSHTSGAAMCHTTRLLQRSNNETMSSFRQAGKKPGWLSHRRSFGPEPRGRVPGRRLPCVRGFKQGQLSLPGNERRSVVRSFSPKLSNLDFGAKFHHLSRGHAEEGCGAFGVVLQKYEESFAPCCHAHDLVTRDDRLAADVVSDMCGIDAA